MGSAFFRTEWDMFLDSALYFCGLLQLPFALQTIQFKDADPQRKQTGPGSLLQMLVVFQGVTTVTSWCAGAFGLTFPSGAPTTFSVSLILSILAGY